MDFHYEIDARCPHDDTKQLDKGFGWQALGNIEEQKLHVITTALQ